MIESKKGGLSLSVESTKLVGDVAVGVCFALDCDGCTFHKLCGSSNCSPDCHPKGAEEAVIGYALYAAVRQVLCGDPLAVSKTKVGAVECVIHNGMVGINWKVKGTGSAVRKSIGMALKVLDPSKMYPAYSRCIKQLNVSLNKEHFMYVADEAAKAIKSNVQISVVGNIKLDKPKLEAMLEVLVKKHDPNSPKGPKSKPSGHVECDHSRHTELKVSGWSSAVLADYIRSKVKGLEPMLCNKSMLLPIKPAQWDTLATKLKKDVKDFAKLKYAKVGDGLPAVFGYLALSSGQLCASDVKAAINNKLSADSIASAISKAL